MKQKIEQLVSWLQDQVRQANMNGLVVGVSGGIDSAVVTYLAKKAFPDTSLAVIMPCKSNPQDQQDAKKVVQHAKIDAIEVDLTESHNQLFQAINSAIREKGDFVPEREQLGDANLRARLRMSTLYTIGNNYKYLVCGTDNAAEWYTGYFTKYGDGGVDLVPLVHFTKGEVYDMARALGVPNDVIDKAPSAGLWDGQTDETEMGTTYNKIDAYLKGESIPEADRERIEALHRRSAHKRRLPAAPPDFH